MKHISVLKEEVIDLLQIKPDGVYLDLTLGAGGHSLEILNMLANGTLICFDVDIKAIVDFTNELKSTYESLEEVSTGGPITKLKINKAIVYLVNRNFEEVSEIIEELEITKVDGIIADLGWSLDQLDNIKGLSYQNGEDDLDMRFRPDIAVTAADLLNGLGKNEMKKMFDKYSDIRGKDNTDLLEGIFRQRAKHKFVKVSDLLELIDKTFHKIYTEKHQLYARTFQALRIAVNTEIYSIETMLNNAWKVLGVDGKLEVITFHSLEEKTVKSFLTNLSKESYQSLSTEQGAEYLRPTIDELMDNPRSRSAKLWAIKKIDGK